MNKPKMTFFEAIKTSWQNELRIGNPWRIARLAFWTVWLSIYRVVVVLIPRVWNVLIVKLLNMIPGIHADNNSRK